MDTVATWTQDLEFRVQFPHGEALTLASVPVPNRPGPGPSPVEALLAALASCSGIDVVLILGRMRKTLTGLRIEVAAARRDEEPRVFTHIDLAYHVEGPDIDPASVTRAVTLSQEKYCSVAAMLRPSVELGWRIVLNGQPLGT
jgi:putative redox protein